jgi:hypothetical protein
MKKSSRRSLAIALACIASSVAHAEIAVIVNPANPASSMTAQEVANVFLLRDERMRPIDLPEAGGLHNWFYYRLTGRDTTQVKVSRLKNLNKLPPVLAGSSADAVRRVASNKRAIAYVDTRSVDSSVKVVMTIATPDALDRLRGTEKERCGTFGIVCAQSVVASDE